MKLVKEITTKTHESESYLIEEAKQYHYDSEEEREQHKIKMDKDGYINTGQVRENIGSVMKPEYVWFGGYYKYDRVMK